ncbi:hypothetical protein OSSY52_03310 [Tepiditoga spiralis]|uniref:Major facilitator superfamily (MFS) profile domain-containing protein n=1 Tax=Tepiditoga spiralis TaxID=2108365 RepID=A0A7G1G1S4_9BACT|nr:MFS transporter [Tepiditoga spiralis]BBE30190.1 hypothetical protein OSSY52_03310 [Tepiditoga spiralis]
MELKKRNFVFLSLLLFSILVNTLAPIMTSIKSTFNVSIIELSFVPTLSTVGSMLSNFIGAMIIAQLGLKSSLLITIIFGVIGTSIFAISSSFLMILFGIFFIGVSMGTAFTTLTSFFAHLDEKYQNYGFFHACFGFGGILAPVFIAFLLKYNIDFRTIYAVYSVLLIVLFFYVLLTNTMKNTKYEAIRFREALKILSRKFVYISLIIFVLYAGVEIGYVTWSGTLFNKFNITKENASLILSGFWIVFTFARILTEKINKKIGLLKTISIFSFFSALSIILLLFTHNYLFFISTGIFLGPIFPSVQKFSNSKLSNREVGLFSGLVYGSTGIGQLIIVNSMALIGSINILYSYVLPMFILFTLILLKRLLNSV